MGQHCWFSPRSVHAEMVLWQWTIFAGHFSPIWFRNSCHSGCSFKFIKCRESDRVIWIDLMLERHWTVEYFKSNNHVFSQAMQPRQSEVFFPSIFHFPCKFRFRLLYLSPRANWRIDCTFIFSGLNQQFIKCVFYNTALFLVNSNVRK